MAKGLGKVMARMVEVAAHSSVQVVVHLFLKGLVDPTFPTY